jgi:twinkle protein
MPNGDYLCFKCRYLEKKTGEPVKKTSKINIKDIEKLPIGSDPTRKLSKKVEDLYKVRVAFDEEKGQIKRVYYPHYEGEELVYTKIRTLPKDFFSAGDKSKNGIWGKHTVPKIPLHPLYITEGEEDALALATIFEHSTREGYFVSLPNGAAIDEAVKRDIDFLSRFKEVVIVTDQDGPGKRVMSDLADFLIPLVKNIYTAELPEKDASECLKKGLILEAGKAVTTERKRFEPEGVISGADITLEEIMTPTPEGFSLPWPKLQDKLHGIRKAELTTLCAGSGIGKSTFAKEIGYHLIKKHNAKICHIALEDLVQTVVQSYIAMDNSVPLYKFRFNPRILTEEQIDVSRNSIISPSYFFKHFGSLHWKPFLAKLEWYGRSASVDFIILDHLSMVVSGTEESNERKAIDMIMTELAKICVETGVGIISIVHLKRSGDNKDFNTGAPVSLTDLRGSAALEQLSWNVISVERNQQAEDGQEDYSTIRVLKNRTLGFTGKADTLMYNHSTGRLDLSEDEDEDIGSTIIDPPSLTSTPKSLEL